MQILDYLVHIVMQLESPARSEATHAGYAALQQTLAKANNTDSGSSASTTSTIPTAAHRHNTHGVASTSQSTGKHAFVAVCHGEVLKF